MAYINDHVCIFSLTKCRLGWIMHSKVKRYMEYLFHVLLAGDVSGRSWIIVARGPAVPAAEALKH
jgi:hypothetical protein